MNEEIKIISDSDPMNHWERLAKLQEECGELSVEILKKYKKKKGKMDEGPLGESIDVILVACSIFFNQGGTVDQFNKIIKIKSTKWKKKHCNLNQKKKN